MRRAVVIFLAACTVMALGPLEVASAGGNWIQFNRDYLVAGKQVRGHNRYFDRQDVGQGPYYAYLLPQTKDWSTPLRLYRGAHVLGRVQIEWPGPNTHWKGSMRKNPKLTFSGTVPEVAAGNYLVSICDMPCTDRLAEIEPTGVRVVESGVEARLLAEVDRLQYELDLFQQATRRARVRVGRVLARDLESAESEMRDRFETLEGRISSLRPSAADQREAPAGDASLLAAVAGIVLALAVAAWLADRRRRRSGGGVDWDRLLADQEVTEAAPESRSGGLVRSD